uniref:Uncharacterized protein n=1 Tax=Rhizophora mucronata TaxID=61149 RepID=A0A2P2NQQ6_RHIMU
MPWKKATSLPAILFTHPGRAALLCL